MSAQATEQQAAIELIVDQDPEGQVAANVPVRWKISPEMVQLLAEKGIEPFMLLVVTNGEHEMDRILAPLKLGMTYLQMRRPGTNTIHAAIVWRKDGEDSVKRIINAKDDHGNYKLDLVRRFNPGVAALDHRIEQLGDIVYRYESTITDEAIREAKRERQDLATKRKELRMQDRVFGLYDGFTAIERTIEGDQINVEVPAEMFAGPPPRWMKWLGTLYKWPRKYLDQCDLRKRAVATLISFPVVIPLGLVAGFVLGFGWVCFKLGAVLVTGVLLFFGKRDLDYSVIYEPDNLDLKDIWYRAKPSFWLYKKTTRERPSGWDSKYMISETEYVRRDPAFGFINPPFMLFSFVIGRLIDPLFGGGTSVVSVAAGAVAGAVVFGLIAAFIAKWMDKRNAAASDKKQVVTAEQRSKLERDLSLLTSGGAAKLSDLPMGQRTVRLRYLHLKAAVCKPFAQ